MPDIAPARRLNPSLRQGLGSSPRRACRIQTGLPALQIVQGDDGVLTRAGMSESNSQRWKRSCRSGREAESPARPAFEPHPGAICSTASDHGNNRVKPTTPNSQPALLFSPQALDPSVLLGPQVMQPAVETFAEFAVCQIIPNQLRRYGQLPNMHSDGQRPAAKE